MGSKVLPAAARLVIGDDLLLGRTINTTSLRRSGTDAQLLDNHRDVLPGGAEIISDDLHRVPLGIHLGDLLVSYRYTFGKTLIHDDKLYSIAEESTASLWSNFVLWDVGWFILSTGLCKSGDNSGQFWRQ